MDCAIWGCQCPMPRAGFLHGWRCCGRKGPSCPTCRRTPCWTGWKTGLVRICPTRAAPKNLRALDLLPALRARLDWAQSQMLDEQAPAHFVSPLGNRRARLDYSGDAPEVQFALAEGTVRAGHATDHRAGAGALCGWFCCRPLVRPVQVTTDLPGFWANSYADVRKDMRGQYPKHPWPENPVQADPTLRAKPRKG